MERSIPAFEARRNFGKLLQEVSSRGDRFVVERHGEPVAALVPIEVYEQWKAARDAFFARIRAAALHAALSPEEAEAVSNEAVRAVRRSHEGRQRHQRCRQRFSDAHRPACKRDSRLAASTLPGRGLATNPALLRLADEFGASVEATAIAWVALDLWPSAVVVFEERLKPTQTKATNQLFLPTVERLAVPEPELRVNIACLPPCLGSSYIPRHKSVRRDGAIYAALSEEGRTVGPDILELSGRTVNVETESVYLPYERRNSSEENSQLGPILRVVNWRSGDTRGA